LQFFFIDDDDDYYYYYYISEHIVIKFQKREQIQREEAEKLQLVRGRLQQQSFDEADYGRDVIDRQQRRMKQASDRKTVAERQQTMVGYATADQTKWHFDIW